MACLLGVMFAAFIGQIVFRYFFGLPTGSLYELTVITWLWLVLWGSAFILEEREEIRFDLLYVSAGRRARRAMALVSGIALIVLYAASFPAAVRYVAFMKVERTDYLHICLDVLYSIFVIVLAAILVRYGWLLWRLLQGREADEVDATKVSSGL